MHHVPYGDQTIENEPSDNAAAEGNPVACWMDYNAIAKYLPIDPDEVADDMMDDFHARDPTDAPLSSSFAF